MSNDSARSSISNHEIWMREIKLLNDNREGLLINDIFDNKSWLRYDWAKGIKPCLKRKYYVNCFSRIKPSEKMRKKYGDNIYGYKTDRIADDISPIIVGTKSGIPQFGQVVCFDICYSKIEAKKEINFLFSLINKMKISDKGKEQFAQDLIEYWIYSFKDNKWKK